MISPHMKLSSTSQRARAHPRIAWARRECRLSCKEAANYLKSKNTAALTNRNNISLHLNHSNRLSKTQTRRIPEDTASMLIIQEPLKDQWKSYLRDLRSILVQDPTRRWSTYSLIASVWVENNYNLTEKNHTDKVIPDVCLVATACGITRWFCWLMFWCCLLAIAKASADIDTVMCTFLLMRPDSKLLLPADVDGIDAGDWGWFWPLWEFIEL